MFAFVLIGVAYCITFCHGLGCSCLSYLTCHESDCHVTLALFTATHLYLLFVSSYNTTSVQSFNISAHAHWSLTIYRDTFSSWQASGPSRSDQNE
ncbi:hypothetical protein BU25DRAFT_25403 [Macroventuria anomochaeta]|uniref:Uncharacterized protein n=1 Tax=Macroventuria anomochaeta TaxID=301207 RepID=A0ACB6S7A1_9PLEO|nr:uncharacterized protein BU25DRAFT_25403 [Macroventuria anomochaeta]KAF2629002.1 hypothetical protein BU25DRAFT_25403 [Macroventuria anomochaeta]